MKFLGTGAAEAVPAVFCECDYCQYAREHKGKDIRTRSSFRINDRVQIDISPDIFMQMVNQNLSMNAVRHLLITHSHSDHLDVNELLQLENVFHSIEPIHLYMNQRAISWFKELQHHYIKHESKEKLERILEHYIIHPLEYYESYTLDEMEIIPIPSTHFGFNKVEEELCLNYLITLQDKRKLLYAVDTGYYTEEAFHFLQDHKLDLLVLECTFGGRKDRGEYVKGHLDIKNFLLFLDQLKNQGTIDSSTKVFATHINHKHSSHHELLQQEFNASDYNVTVAYDGLSIL